MLIKLRPGIYFTNILGAAFAPIFLRKKLKSQTVTREKLHKTFLYEQGGHKMLIKLTPVDNIPF
jgi:hypothetical protein